MAKKLKWMKFEHAILNSLSGYSGKLLDVGGPTYGLLRKLKIEESFDIYSLNLKIWKTKKKQIKNPPLEFNKFIIGTAVKMPIQEESFDICLSFNVFEHVNEPWNAATECIRILKLGGLLIHYSLFSWRLHDEPDYFRFSHHGLEYLFERTGKVKGLTSMMERMYDERKEWKENWSTLYIGKKVKV